MQERLRIFLANSHFSEFYSCNAKIIFEAIMVIEFSVVKDINLRGSTTGRNLKRSHSFQGRLDFF
jgi:hypothetical protein